MTYTQLRDEDGRVMAEYQQVWDAITNQVSETMVQRTSDGAFVPFDDANTDYQAYKQWLEEGNKPKQPEQKVQK